MKKYVVASWMVFASFAAPAVATAADAEAGKASYAVCSSCHGQNGEGNIALNSPAIAGQEDWYLIRQLKNFKAGIRGKHPKDTHGVTMGPMASTLADDTAIENVAAYIGTFAATKPEVTITDSDADKGKALYAVCSSCHGLNAEGKKELNAPKLTGLQDWYLVRQITNFKEGIRGKDPKDTYGMQMSPMAMTLADEQAIKDVVAYIKTL
ncbi:MAG: Cytochrome c oxidase subunit II [uncultured Thiotrichaceae bacterium]|uniref:Cytochrome c oxidase subunit II n=1 Tax=uncultured Thiotrichaceae bacterium TaxID=298394 RepID=A0A6S6SK59_9GAMM|nr:MAG: Cytochrome c oxidase subunit II [uncultured Thiotrichaceae bacterium]